MTSFTDRMRELSDGLAESTDSGGVHMRTLRKGIGYVALALPFALVCGENVRDRLLPGPRVGGRVIIEASISAYFHTGVRDLFVGSLCAIAVFLLCYKGYQRIDDIAANIAGFSVLLVALFPTFERSREASDTGIKAPDSVTLFSGPNGADPGFVGNIHFAAAAVFFIVLAVMSLFLFTRSDQPEPTPQKLWRNRIFRVCGLTILASIALIAVGKLAFSDAWEQRTSFVFWMETIAVIAFGISWLTKAEVLFGDRDDGDGGLDVPPTSRAHRPEPSRL